MTDARFAGIARSAVATVSRRASLSALGVAALSAATFPSQTEAKKRCSKKSADRCAKQNGFCAVAVADVCNAHPTNPDLCNGRCSQCCFNLRNCDASEVYDSLKCLMRCVP